MTILATVMVWSGVGGRGFCPIIRTFSVSWNTLSERWWVPNQGKCYRNGRCESTCKGHYQTEGGEPVKETESKQSKKLDGNVKSGPGAAKELQGLRLAGRRGDPRGCPFWAAGAQTNCSGLSQKEKERKTIQSGSLTVMVRKSEGNWRVRGILLWEKLQVKEKKQNMSKVSSSITFFWMKTHQNLAMSEP